MNFLIWAIILILVGFLLVALELFIPSGGILGFLAVTAVIASLVLAVLHGGSTTGIVFVAVAVVGFPAAILLALKYWPRTRLGRRVLLDIPAEDDVLPETDDRFHLEGLIGRFGTAETKMLPSGTIKIEKKTYEAISEGMPIEPGQTVEVVQTRNNRLVVRLADRQPPQGEVGLSERIESLGIDPFEDPLA